MIIQAFGATYATAYVFPNVAASDSLPIARPAQTARVSVRNGVFDYMGDKPYQHGAQTVTKSFTVVAATYAGVETTLEALRAATIAQDESKLWCVMRDGSRRWAWAKCVSFSAPDMRGAFLDAQVTLEFLCREGLWYNEAIHQQGKSSDGTVTLNNAGNVNTPVKISTGSGTGTLAQFSASTAVSGWDFAGAVFAGNDLIVDAAAYTATNNGANCYSSMTFDDSDTFWLAFAPGDNVLTISSLVGGGASFSALIEWYDCWVM